MQDFRKIEAWVKAHALVLAVYEDTRKLPRDEIFGVTMQIRRTAVQMASQIAEGAGRSNNAEFAADLRKAAAHSNHLEYLFLLAQDLNYWNTETAKRLTERGAEVRMMIFGLLRTF